MHTTNTNRDQSQSQSQARHRSHITTTTVPISTSIYQSNESGIPLTEGIETVHVNYGSMSQLEDDSYTLKSSDTMNQHMYSYSKYSIDYDKESKQIPTKQTSNQSVLSKEQQEHNVRQQCETDYQNANNIHYSNLFLRIWYWFMYPERQSIYMLKINNPTNNNIQQMSFSLISSSIRLFHRLLSEVIGTMLLVFFHGGLRLAEHKNLIPVSSLGLAGGLTLLFLIDTCGHIGGAHFNPVITMAFVLHRAFPLRWMIFYWIAQFGGACSGGALLYAFWGNETVYANSAVRDEFSNYQGFWFECILTFALAYTALNTARDGKIAGPHAALAVAAVIACDMTLGHVVSSASMNPFRSLGPMIITGHVDGDYWPFLAGPTLGAVFAVIITYLMSSSFFGQAGFFETKSAVGAGTA